MASLKRIVYNVKTIDNNIVFCYAINTLTRFQLFTSYFACIRALHSCISTGYECFYQFFLLFWFGNQNSTLSHNRYEVVCLCNNLRALSPYFNEYQREFSVFFVSHESFVSLSLPSIMFILIKNELSEESHCSGETH